MLELNKWLFVQLLNFLILMILLNIILFRPLLRLFKERDRRIKGFHDESQAMSREKDEMLRQMEARLSEARNQARKISGELIKEGVETQKQILDAARQEAARLTEKAQEEIEASVSKARDALKRDVEAFSRKIIEKILET